MTCVSILLLLLASAVASFAAEEKLNEVKEVGAEAIISACGRCKNNFNKTESSLDNKVKAYDISEIILASLGL